MDNGLWSLGTGLWKSRLWAMGYGLWGRDGNDEFKYGDSPPNNAKLQNEQREPCTQRAER